jgi:hypothetical protein
VFRQRGSTDGAGTGWIDAAGEGDEELDDTADVLVTSMVDGDIVVVTLVCVPEV